MEVKDISLSTNISMEVQGVSLSTANRMDMQGVTISTARSMEVQYPGCMPFHHQQYGRAVCINFHC
jgi:hypothetical protein